MRLSDLRDKKVRTLDGESLGRVHEVHCNEGQVTALTSGPGGFLERMTGKRGGRRIAWECVAKISEREIVVTPDPPKKKPNGSRSRRGTPRPSARRSRR